MRLVNCYAEQGQGKGDIILRGTSGISSLTTLPKYPQRGAIKFQKKPHVVAGETLYRVENNGTYVALGVIPGNDYTPMAQNGAQIAIVTNTDGYIYDGTTVNKITDPDFRPAIDCTFNGNYIVFVEKNSGRFFGSELGDANDYDALDFATAESDPDDLVGITSDHADLFLAGADSCEIWGNVGGSGFPFSRRFNGVIEQGCGAGQSLVNADQTVFWIDDLRMARRLDGVTPIRISQHGVEAAWEGYSTIEDAEGYTYAQDGHIFVVWNFPTAGKTWAYDVVTRQWAERESYHLNMSRSRWCMNVYNKILCGDRDTGNIGILSPETYQEYGDPLVMTWQYPTVYAKNDLAFHHELDIVAETGVGNNNDLDPKIMLEVSDDGGRTFDHLPATALGAMGEYKTRTTWAGLGSSADRVYRGSIAAPVERAVFQTHLRATGGQF